MKIIYEDIHVATQELNKVSTCLEKSEKTNPYTLKKTQRFSQSFATSISEALHISFQPTETRLLFDYLKHLATKRDISGILFVGANNSTDCTYLNLMPAVLTELHVRDILLSDLHIDNIMIDESGGFALIDVDSAQVKQHITSGWRASSALPSLMQAVKNGKINQHFRLIQEDLFAFYITVFEIFIGIHPLFNLNENPNFCSHKFIFSGKSNHVPVDAQQAWMDLSITQRAFFFKTFFEFDIPSLSEYHKVFLN